MRSDAKLGAMVVMFVVLLTGGLKLALAGRTDDPARDRTAQLESGERVRLMLEAARRSGSGRAGS